MTAKPRRCSKRWLDDDCPKEILAIMDHPRESDRYTVFYNDPFHTSRGRETWLTFLALDDNAMYYHGEMQAHEVAAYRYRMKHRYTTWSSLPDAVKNAVRADIAAAKEYEEANK